MYYPPQGRNRRLFFLSLKKKKKISKRLQVAHGSCVGEAFPVVGRGGWQSNPFSSDLVHPTYSAIVLSAGEGVQSRM